MGRICTTEPSSIDFMDRPGKISIFALEKDLIPPGRWQSCYPRMPQRCKDEVDIPHYRDSGIGYNPKNGWYILDNGDIPKLVWAEDKSLRDMIIEEL